MTIVLSDDRRARDEAVWRNTTVAIEAFKKARAQPEEVAIYLENEPDATYGAIADEARRLISALQELGLQSGDVLSFQF
ncbi:MAG: non-ribosomal peptide synthetase component E (peptide arylation enzyme), partial [Halieaceae bacterium]